METRDLFFSWVGFGRFPTWSIVLKLPSPWSPPALIHVSLDGIVPLCHVSLLFWSYWFNTDLTKSGMFSIIICYWCFNHVIIGVWQSSLLNFDCSISDFFLSISLIHSQHTRSVVSIACTIHFRVSVQACTYNTRTKLFPRAAATWGMTWIMFWTCTLEGFFLNLFISLSSNRPECQNKYGQEM